MIAEQYIATAPPSPTGGSALTDGKYYLTAWESYTGAGGLSGPSGESRKATLVVNGNLIQIAATDIEAAGNEDLPIVAATYTKNGTTLDSTEVCPVVGRPLNRGFVANNTTLELYTTVGMITTRAVYTKQ